MCEIHMHNLKSHFQQDFLAYCTRPVSVHLAMVCVGCSLDSFSIFFALFYTTKSHKNCVFLYPFFNVAISPQNNEKNVFYTGKLYGLTGMHMCFMIFKVVIREVFPFITLSPVFFVFFCF